MSKPNKALSKIKQGKKPVAQMSNDFALKAQIGLDTSRKLSLFLILVSQIDPKDEGDMIGVVSLQSLDNLFKTDKWSGSLREQLNSSILDMMKATVTFISDIEYNGTSLPKVITIFDTLEPYKVGGSVFYKYKFNDSMRPHITGFLKNFVRVQFPKGIKSVYSIRFLIMAKAHHDRLRAFKPVTTFTIEVETLKKILLVEGKYRLFNNFKRRIITPMIKGVNDSQVLEIIDYQLIKSGRTVTHIEFKLTDGALSINKQLDMFSSNKDTDKLTFSQYRAYQFLIEKGIKSGIAYTQIIKKIKSSEFVGWEDLYIEITWASFEKNTKYKKKDSMAGAFVKWWQSGEFKDKLFSEIMEALQHVKKQKSDEELSNRSLAKGMTHLKFVEQYKKSSVEIKEE